MESMTAATYTHGTAILAEHVSVLDMRVLGVPALKAPVQTLGFSAEHGVARGAGQWLATPTNAVASIALTPACSALRAQTAQAACTGTVIFEGGSFSGQTGSPVVIADDKPNFRTGRLPRDRQPV